MNESYYLNNERIIQLIESNRSHIVLYALTNFGNIYRRYGDDRWECDDMINFKFLLDNNLSEQQDKETK